MPWLGCWQIYFLSGYFITAAKERNLNVRTLPALHVMLGDLLGSVGAIIAALIIIWTGWTPADPILSILVSCFWFCVARGDC
ncbi:cation transporter [Escherichia coli]|nr:cation transporter [Escherichia coli]